MKKIRVKKKIPVGTETVSINLKSYTKDSSIGLLIYDSMNLFRGGLFLKYKEEKSIILSEGKSTKGFISTYIPYGDWTFEIFRRDNEDKELEYELKVEIQRGKRKYQWIKGEFHTHTIASDGKLKASDLAKFLKERDFSFFFITDHNTFGIEEITDFGDIIAFPGIEITSPTGHMLILGEVNLKSKSIFTRFPIYSPVIGIAHPYSVYDPGCPDCSWKRSLLPADYIEIWNSNTRKMPYDLKLKALSKWKKLLKTKKLSIISGADFHNPNNFDYNNWYPTWVLLSEIRMEEVLNALIQGYTISGDIEKIDENKIFFNENMLFKDIEGKTFYKGRELKIQNKTGFYFEAYEEKNEYLKAFSSIFP